MIAYWKQFILGVILSLFIIFLMACQATVGGSKTGEKYKLKRNLTMPNYWETIIHKDVKPVYDAVLAGLGDLGLKVSTSKVDRLSGFVEGFFADGSEFRIRISYEGPETTVLLIKAGFTGSKTRSTHIFRAIEKHF